MTFLRTTSTARLLALVAGVVVAGAATAAIALAAAGGGAGKPPPKPLAQAVHDALAAPRVAGVTARIRFTNHLIDSSAIPGAGALLTGADGRLWASADGRLRLELQSSSGDVQVVRNGQNFLVYDGSSNTAYRGVLPPDRPSGAKQHQAVPSIGEIQRSIGDARKHAGVSGAIPLTVAGRSAYELRITPQHGGLVSGARLAWDAIRGVPLRVALYARGDGSPVLALTARKISFGSVPASVFAISPPKGAHVVEITPPAAPAGHRGKAISGLRAVRAALPFQLSAPPKLARKARQEVKLLGSGTHAGALVTYGQGLDGLVLVEQAADPSAPPASLGGVHLPSVTIGGSVGQELPTALGTVVRFTRAGVQYTLAGSLPAGAVIAAARSL